MGNDTTEILSRARAGDSSAVNRLLDLVYDELHDLAERSMQRECPDHTLQPTALAHDAFLKLIDQSRVDWRGRTHFLAVAATQMRRILVDHARSRSRLKRAGVNHRVPLNGAAGVTPGPDFDLLALDELLTRLATFNPLGAQVIELRFFGGLTMDEIARHVDTPKRTIESKWAAARSWLHAHLRSGDTGIKV